MSRRNFIIGTMGGLVGGLVSAAGCGRREESPAPPTVIAPHPSTILDKAQIAAAPSVTRHPITFTDITGKAGLNWSYANGATGQHLFIETVGGGVAFFDYNNDGLIDIFAVQGGPIPGGAAPADKNFPTRNALYRNNGDGTFTDVTAGSGLDAYTGYGQGVSAADYDNDGWSDLYITSYGGNHLFRNNRNGTFTDVTAHAGVSDVESEANSGLPWPLSSAWADYDNDGFLDLFVCHYVHWSRAIDRPCHGSNGELYYCRPEVYDASHCRLYHNNGDGTFTDVTHKSGLYGLTSKNMGAAWIDYDDDGWMDLFVTNDTKPNLLLHNNRNGTFTDVATISDVAVSSQGEPLSGMGIAIGDYQNEGRPSLFVVNYQGQPKSVYHNMGQGLFENASYTSSVASMNLQYLGFGLECLDYDLDGFQDVIVGNGHVLDNPGEDVGSTSYAQSQQLLHNQHNGTFVDDLKSLGDLAKPRVTRGLAVGDFDNDGDVDVVMVGQNEPLQLFRNDGGNQNGWITFRLEGVRSNRDGVGARVSVHAGSQVQTQWVRGGSSFCSQSDLRLTFGLGDLRRIDKLIVKWPRGSQQTFSQLAGNRFYYLKEGADPVLDSRIKQG